MARVRRRMPLAELAVRSGATRVTLRKLERGNLTVSLGLLVRVLGILGLESDLDRVAAEDELGRRLQEARMTRPRRSNSRT